MKARFVPLVLIILISACAERDTFVSPVAQTYLPIVRRGSVLVIYSELKGLGVPAVVGNCYDPARVGALWWHNWFPQPFLSGCSSGFVPTIGRVWLLGKPVATDSGPLFTFNEPDQPSQANLTPEQAAILWAELEETYPNHDLIAPTVSQRDYDWIKRFYIAYKVRYGRTPRLWALSLNCYLPVEECMTAVIEMRSQARRWGLPGGVWLKEINCPIEDMESLVNTLDAWGVHYSWFLSSNPNGNDLLYRRPLFEDDRATDFGESYRMLPEGTVTPVPIFTRIPP